MTSKPLKEKTWDELSLQEAQQVYIDLYEQYLPLEYVKCLESFWKFNKFAMAWKDLYDPLHERVCNFVQENIAKRNVMLLLPRGTFKSSVVTVSYPLWMLANNPKSRGLIANATYDLARRFVGQMERVLQGETEFKRIFGDMATGATVWREDQFLVSSNKEAEGSKEASVTAYGLTSNFVGSHFDYAILDDMVNRENVKSKEGLDKPKQFYRDVLDLVDPDENGHRPVIVIGTTWHYNDLYADLMKNSEFATLRLPAYEGEWGTGKLLFPTRLTWKALKKQKDKQGSAHFSAQYLLDPVSFEDAAFKMDFRYYEETDIKGLELYKFFTIDPAISEKTSADYSAMICIGVDKKGTWYILDIWRDRVNPKRLIDQIFYWDTKWKPVKVGVETVAFQKTLQFYIYDEMKKRHQYIPIVELKHAERTKLERILALEPRYETGMAFHNKDMGLTEELEMEMRSVTRDGIKGTHDDLVDALASLMEIAFPPKNKEQRLPKKYGSRFYPA